MPYMHSYSHLQPGQRIELVEMPDDPHPVEPGTRGTVVKVHVHDPPQRASSSIWEDGRPVQTNVEVMYVEAIVEVKWDMGRSISVILPKDTIIVLDELTHE